MTRLLMLMGVFLFSAHASAKGVMLSHNHGGLTLQVFFPPVMKVADAPLMVRNPEPLHAT
jgi:hypothetical protein